MVLINQPNILLISGSGQNTGKTTFICKLINHLCTKTNIVAIKITHHFYALTYPMPVFAKEPDFEIYEETNKTMPKDSSRMLNSGASKVYFIMSKKEHIGDAINLLLSKLSTDANIICESGGLANYFKPGLHLHLTDKIKLNEKPLRNGCVEVRFNGFNFSPYIENIVSENNIWKIDLQKNDII